MRQPLGLTCTFPFMSCEDASHVVKKLERIDEEINYMARCRCHGTLIRRSSVLADFIYRGDDQDEARAIQ